jgi:hypothetical protein
MKRAFGLVLVSAVALAVVPACSKKAKEEPSPAENRDLGQQVGATLWDERVVGEATGPANIVIRALGDCDAVKAALPEAEAKLTEALAKVRTGPGRASLESMRAQVKRIADTCP